MRRRFFVFIFLVTGALLAQAHEFWLQPLKFIFARGEDITINFKVGENFIGEQWNLKRHRLERLELHNVRSVLELKEKVTGDSKDNLQITAAEEGTHLFVMQSNNAFSDLEAEKFNAYLKEDGLDEVYSWREKNNALDKNGLELYARNSKLLVQVGTKKDDTYKKIAGLTAEIIPAKSIFDESWGSRPIPDLI